MEPTFRDNEGHGTFSPNMSVIRYEVTTSGDGQVAVVRLQPITVVM